MLKMFHAFGLFSDKHTLNEVCFIKLYFHHRFISFYDQAL